MQFDDVIMGRRSIRGYLDKPVPRELIEEILALVDASNEPVDVVDYENPSYAPGSAWPADDTVSSIYLLPTALNKTANDLGSGWARSTTQIDGAYDSVQTAWFSDIRGTGSTGSPGVVWTGDHQSPTGEVVFTEIMYHPNSDPGDPTRPNPMRY